MVPTTSLAALDPAKIPLTVVLKQRILYTEDAVKSPAKKTFDSPRPPVADDQVKPLIKLDTQPMGQLLLSYFPAFCRSRGRILVPEKRAELMARVEDYATSRVIVCVRYRSDLAAGFASGALIAQERPENNDFQKEAAAAKQELRVALS